MSPSEIPKFEAPQPTSGQERAMRWAGRLLTAGDPEDPNVTLDALITDVGGYEQLGDNARIGQNPGDYRHRSAKTKIVGLRRDETTTEHSFKQAPESSQDFHDLEGYTNREQAIQGSISGFRVRPDGLSLKQRAARRLVKKATKGVGIQPYIKPSK